MSTMSLPRLELPPLQLAQLGKHCISMPIFAFNAVYPQSWFKKTQEHR